ncbi:MAG: TerC family protein [Desulfobacterales bacterium]|nr:MAG: TerC family protein [Desulfobacterales bacterium]
MGFSIFSQMIAELSGFAVADALTIATLAALEGILSVDNSLVLAILVRTLPKNQQKKALTYGIVGAFAFRLLALIFAAHMMRFVFFKLIGGAYLIYLAMKHMFFFYKEDAHQARPKTAASFWKTVLVVELTDIAFSIDSITTAVAMSNKLAIVWVGGVLGILFLRFAAGAFVRLLEKLPKLEDLAYQLIFFIGTKLFLEGFQIEIGHGIFWMMMGIIAVLGLSLVYRDYYQRKTQTQYRHRLLEQFIARQITLEEILSLDYVPGDIISYLRQEQHILIQHPFSSSSVPPDT